MRAKLARAREHLNALRAAIDEHLDARPYRIEHERDVQDGDDVFRLFVERPFPLSLGVIVGDFAHNARSALDHLVYVLSTGAHPDRSQFPFALTKASFQSQAADRLRGVPAPALQAIELVQPFRHQPNPHLHPLAALNELSNVDKHRLIHASYATSADEEPDVEVEFVEGPDESAARVIYMPNVALADGAEILRVRLYPAANEPDVALKGGVPVAVAFGERRLQLQQLHQIQDAVVDVVETYVGVHAANARTSANHE